MTADGASQQVAWRINELEPEQTTDQEEPRTNEEEGIIIDDWYEGVSTFAKRPPHIVTWEWMLGT
ncbi:hypothetical protein GJ744_000744 [Endocarpon pusillum]|uniref:Uncharacterized protein n=1 Tax=Endocarpon pusillum TaxID=364733 RepID=A0A8H7E130_9EURO|nr:hypothetical protein GJ744_000744 [Endocarpon pusillum]